MQRMKLIAIPAMGLIPRMAWRLAIPFPFFCDGGQLTATGWARDSVELHIFVALVVSLVLSLAFAVREWADIVRNKLLFLAAALAGALLAAPPLQQWMADALA